jgi:predicted methyltransferase
MTRRRAAFRADRIAALVAWMFALVPAGAAAAGIGILTGCAAGESREAPSAPDAAATAGVPSAGPSDAAPTGADAGKPADDFPYAEAPHAHASGGQAQDDDATAHHPFDDAQRWAKVFDDPGRDAWQKPAEVIAAMSIRPGMMVADLGAGTGYFTARLSRAVGPEGTVLAIDPEPEMVKHLGQRAHKDGLENVLPVLGMYEDPFLPRGRVDRVLIVDTYHHIDDRLDYFGQMRGHMAPGGRLVVVDFHKRPLPVGPPPEHKLEREKVVREMEAAGWRLDGEVTTLPYQYVLIFDPAPAAAPSGAPR